MHRFWITSLTLAALVALPVSPSAAPAPDDWRGSPEAVRSAGGPWNMYVIAGGGLSVPVGHFYDGFTAAGGFGASLRLALNDQLAFRAIVRRSNLAEEPVVFLVEDQQLAFVPSPRTDADIWRIYSALEYFRPLNRPLAKRPSEFFLFGGLGLVRNSLTLHYNEVYRDNDLALISGAGVMLMLSESVGVELGTSFDLVFTGGREWAPADSDIAGIWDLTAALAIALPVR